MSGRFAGLKSLQQDEAVLQESPAREDPVEAAGTATTAAVRPWEAAGAPTEPIKALNGRVPRSVRLAFDRQLTDAMDVLGTDITVDLAVESLARLVVEDPEVRERWLHKLWTLKRR